MPWFIEIQQENLSEKFSDEFVTQINTMYVRRYNIYSNKLHILRSRKILLFDNIFYIFLNWNYQNLN